LVNTLVILFADRADRARSNHSDCVEVNFRLYRQAVGVSIICVAFMRKVLWQSNYRSIRD